MFLAASVHEVIERKKKMRSWSDHERGRGRRLSQKELRMEDGGCGWRWMGREAIYADFLKDEF